MADLVREDGRVDDAEARDAEYAQAWVDDARLGGCADASGRRLAQKKTHISFPTLEEGGGGESHSRGGTLHCSGHLISSSVIYTALW
jgi:hypothetical protein